MSDPSVTVTPSKVVRTDLMPAHVLDNYNGLLAAGDAAADAGDLDAAKGLWARAEDVAKPFTEKIPETVETPAPSWTSQPKEGLRDSGKPIIVSLAPDVCKTPMGSATPPIPYSITAIPGEDAGTTPTVRMTGQKAFVMRSNTTCVHGDEPGTAKGVKSGTVGDIAEPIDHSTSVRAEGSCIIRHGDKFYMNSCNTQGEAIWCEDMGTNDGGSKTAPPPSADAPDPPIEPETPEEQGWLDRQLAKVGEAYDAVAETAGEVADDIAEFDRNNFNVVTRVGGVAQGVGGIVEMAAGAVLVGGGGVATATGVGTAPGVLSIVGGSALFVNGGDNTYTGFKTAFTGEAQHNLASQALGGAAEALGASPETADSIRDTTDLVSGVAGGVAGGAGAVSRAGQRATREVVEEGAEEAAKAAAKSADDAAEATVPATTKTGDAIDHGGENVRVTSNKSLRIEYLGKTPGKKSRTGREVIDRMRKEGKIKGRAPHEKFLASDGNWYPLKEADMAHKTDAVTYWNTEGRYYGAKSKEVRAWMLDSNNYYLEHYSINRSQGARLGETYLPPANM